MNWESEERGSEKRRKGRREKILKNDIDNMIIICGGIFQ